MKTDPKLLENQREKQALLFKDQIHNQRIIAKDIMIQPVILYLDDTIETILEKLQSEEVNHCIVIGENKKFIWEVTDEMLLKIIAHHSVHEPLVKILDIGYKRGINYTHTRDYVKKHKNTVLESTPLFDIMKLIDKKWFQFIPVVDGNKNVVGLITPSCILRFILNR